MPSLETEDIERGPAFIDFRPSLNASYHLWIGIPRKLEVENEGVCQVRVRNGTNTFDSKIQVIPPILCLTLALRFSASVVNNPEKVSCYDQREADFFIPSFVTSGLGQAFDSYCTEFVRLTYRKQTILDEGRAGQYHSDLQNMCNIGLFGSKSGDLSIHMSPPAVSDVIDVNIQQNGQTLLEKHYDGGNQIFSFLKAINGIRIYLDMNFPELADFSAVFFPYSVCSDLGQEYIFKHNLALQDAISLNAYRQKTIYDKYRRRNNPLSSPHEE